jgi:hypothetical protein
MRRDLQQAVVLAFPAKGFLDLQIALLEQHGATELRSHGCAVGRVGSERPLRSAQTAPFSKSQPAPGVSSTDAPRPQTRRYVNGCPRQPGCPRRTAPACTERRNHAYSPHARAADREGPPLSTGPVTVTPCESSQEVRNARTRLGHGEFIPFLQTRSRGRTAICTGLAACKTRSRMLPRPTSSCNSTLHVPASPHAEINLLL